MVIVVGRNFLLFHNRVFFFADCKMLFNDFWEIVRISFSINCNFLDFSTDNNGIEDFNLKYSLWQSLIFGSQSQFSIKTVLYKKNEWLVNLKMKKKNYQHWKKHLKCEKKNTKLNILQFPVVSIAEWMIANRL